MSALHPAINQPGVFNIHAWDGKRWRGGMNRGNKADAISTATAWSTQSGQRHRVYCPNGQLIFDSEATAMLSDLVEADREYDEAMEAAEDCEYSKSKHLAANKRLQQAEKRRAAALARVGGAQQ